MAHQRHIGITYSLDINLYQMNEITKPQTNLMTAAEKTVELSAKARDLRAELKRIEDELRPYREQLLQATQQNDVYQLKTGSYTISRVQRISPVVENFEELEKTLQENNIPYETEVVFKNMDMTFKEAIKQKLDWKGLNARVTEYVAVRVTKK